jgi:hypothetical protein
MSIVPSALVGQGVVLPHLLSAEVPGTDDEGVLA